LAAPLHVTMSVARRHPTPGQCRTMRMGRLRAAPLVRSTSVWRRSISLRRARMRGRKAHMTETLPMTRTTTLNASKGLTTCADPMATIETPKASPSGPSLEGKTTLETFLAKQRRWLAAAPTHLHPSFFVSKNSTCRRERVPKMPHIPHSIERVEPVEQREMRFW
jgi:hypothetical protein